MLMDNGFPGLKSRNSPVTPVPAILSYVNDNDAVGLDVGLKVGLSDGISVGQRLGRSVDRVGIVDGIEDGNSLGKLVGDSLDDKNDSASTDRFKSFPLNSFPLE